MKDDKVIILVLPDGTTHRHPYQRESTARGVIVALQTSGCLTKRSSEGVEIQYAVRLVRSEGQKQELPENQTFSALHLMDGDMLHIIEQLPSDTPELKALPDKVIATPGLPLEEPPSVESEQTALPAESAPTDARAMPLSHKILVGLTICGLLAVIALAFRKPEKKTPPPAPMGVLFALHISPSMAQSGNEVWQAYGVSKINMAKKALTHCVVALAPNSADLLALEAQPVLLASSSNNQATLCQALESYSIKPGHATAGNLCADLETAITQTRQAAKRDLVFVSDGISSDSSPCAQSLIEQARKAGIRIFTIALGNSQAIHAMPVNIEVLERIAQVTSGKHCVFLDLVELEQQARFDDELYGRLLSEKLQPMIRQIQIPAVPVLIQTEQPE